MLSVCADQGGSGLPALLFLAGELKLRMLPMWDPFHRAWRDWQLAVQGAGLWPVVLETTVVMNLPHGPWLNTSFFHRIQESMVQYMRSNSAQEFC